MISIGAVKTILIASLLTVLLGCSKSPPRKAPLELICYRIQTFESGITNAEYQLGLLAVQIDLLQRGMPYEVAKAMNDARLSGSDAQLEAQMKKDEIQLDLQKAIWDFRLLVDVLKSNREGLEKARDELRLYVSTNAVLRPP